LIKISSRHILSIRVKEKNKTHKEARKEDT